LENDESTGMRAAETSNLFDIFLNEKGDGMFEQGSRAIRTEEAILVVMGAVYPYLKKHGLSK